MGDIICGTKLPDYETMQTYADLMTKEFSFLEKKVIGYSCVGREIYTLSYNGTADSVLFAAAFHAQEWLTSLVLLRFCENLCKSIAAGTEFCKINLRHAFTEKGFVFIPCVNPDGVEIALHGAASAGQYADFVRGIMHADPTAWNANARGVDLNHNYNAGRQTLRRLEAAQGILGPSPRRYGGNEAESESETKALTALCRQIPFRHIFALHSQGEEIYWQYGERTPGRSKFMAEILSVSSGYTLCTPDEIASHGGFKDWFIEAFGRPAFTLELGKGKNPLPLSDLDSVYRKAEEMLLIGTIL